MTCSKSKSLSEFSLVSAKADVKLRWAPKCKTCKNARRREPLVKIKARRPNNVVTRSKRIIEPTSANEIHGKQANAEFKEMDFADLENYYGKRLSCAERYDVVQGFNEFVELLKDGYGAIVGCEVYVRKDQ